MSVSGRIASFILAAAFVVVFCACCSGNQYAAPTEMPSLSDLPDSAATEDPSKYELGEDGYFEDDRIVAHWPTIFEFTNIQYGNAKYTARTEDGKKLLFAYLRDEGGVYADEVAGFDFDSYGDYLKNDINEYYELHEFSYITVDGHEGMRAVYDYAPPEEGKTVHVMQFLFNVDGWIMSMVFTSQGQIPPECEQSVMNVKFK